LFERVGDSGLHLSILAHISHHREMTETFTRAIKRIQETGALIRSQSPIMCHINDDAEVWAKMWQEQVACGIIPYYMFLPRDTGAREYFSVPLAKAQGIFANAYRRQSGLGRTVRGPVMSADPGKVEIIGVTKIANQRVFMLRLLQSRDPELTLKPFFAKYDEQATWLDDLRPAFADKLIFE
jgi:L-lysine 2,3-aminomutase